MKAPPSSPLMLGAGWPSDQPGGLNRYFRDLFAALQADGQRPTALVVGPVSEPVGSVRGVARHEDAMIRRVVRFAWEAASMGRTATVVNPQFALYAFLPVVLGPLRRAPLVVHFHGPWAEESAAEGASRMGVLAKRWIERAVYRRARLIVVMSSAFKRVLVERYGIAPWDVEVQPPGVRLEWFRPGSREEARSRLGIDGKRSVVVCVRRLVHRMGVDVLLDSWAQLDSDAPDALLLIVGSGPAREGLERRAELLGLDGRVRFVGHASEDRLLDVYRAADVSVVPSVALEGFGAVVVEALACGTPVIVSDVGGLPETVSGLETGLVVPAGDAHALARRLGAALDGTEPLPTRSECREYAEGFRWSAVARRHAEFFSRAVEPHTPRRRVSLVVGARGLSDSEIEALALLEATKRTSVHVLVPRDPLARRLARAGISAQVLGRQSAIRLAARLLRLAPDLVHAHGDDVARRCRLASKVARVPLVSSLRQPEAQGTTPRASALHAACPSPGAIAERLSDAYDRAALRAPDPLPHR